LFHKSLTGGEKLPAGHFVDGSPDNSNSKLQTRKKGGGMKSRTALLLSGMSNCLLLAIIIALAVGRGGSARPPAGSTVAREAPAAASEQNSPSDQAQTPRVEPFRWAQLESTDYPTYVQNLRSVHCPAQTIRDIITADVDGNLFAAKREKLQSRQRQLAAGSPADAGLQRAEQALWNEESSLINRLLGEESPRPSADTAANSWTSAPPVLPLAFAASATNLPGFSEYQLAAVARSRQSFLTNLDGLDPNSTEYAQAWQKAQPQVDAALKAALGNSAYQKLRLEMLRQNLARTERQQ
jgi:hypothetical protein